MAVVTYIVRPSGVKYISSGTPIFIGPKSNAGENVKVFVPGFQVSAASVPSNMLVTYATGGLLPGTNRISTGAALAGDGLVETLISPSQRPVLASMTPTASPGSPRSLARTVLVTRMRSMPLWIAIPCGYLSGSLMVRSGVSVTASPMITASEPIQVTYQVRLSSEKTTSSPTWQSGIATTFTAEAGVRHLDDPELRAAEGGDVRLRLVAVVEDVVGDGVAGQLDVLDHLAERLGAGLEVDHRQAFLPRRGTRSGASGSSATRRTWSRS